jgi:type IV pilus assembly protein PilB
MELGQKAVNTETIAFFGEWLVQKGLLAQSGLADALDEQQRGGGKLGEVLLRLKLLSENDITAALSEYLGLERIELDNVSKLDMNVARLIPENIAKRFCAIAVGEEQDSVVVAMADPLNVIALDTIKQKIKRPIKVVISSLQEIHKAIDVAFHGSDMEEQRLRDLVQLELSEEGEGEDFFDEDMTSADISSEALASKPPVIRFVDLLLSQAVKSRASDIHVEPQENSMAVRMRIDGMLRDMVPPSRKMQAAVVTRIKILSEMDIAERRLPQDGRFKIKAPGREIDVRVNAIPTIYGEKIVMRILDKMGISHNIESLGFEPDLLKKFKLILDQPYGIIIVTGPTGSGKSTTLYSSLNYLKDPRMNITTVEDPVEYRLAGINQVQVKQEIGLDFASCLRAILRQDPDIILIGEIRDKETVEIAIKASLTGHLVLSTFHTNDAPSALSRLTYMGIERYLLASSLNLVIAQRLVRKICTHCKEPDQLGDELLKRLKLDAAAAKEFTYYKGKGCKNCGGTGYLGRTPIFEFLVIDTEIRELIVASATEMQIRAAARQKGYGGLFESAVTRMKQGLTTAEEVLSVTFSEDIG